jgi:hypothetical protein
MSDIPSNEELLSLVGEMNQEIPALVHRPTSFAVWNWPMLWCSAGELQQAKDLWQNTSYQIGLIFVEVQRIRSDILRINAWQSTVRLWLQLHFMNS